MSKLASYIANSLVVSLCSTGYAQHGKVTVSIRDFDSGFAVSNAATSAAAPRLFHMSLEPCMQTIIIIHSGPGACMDRPPSTWSVLASASAAMFIAGDARMEFQIYRRWPLWQQR